MTQMGKLKTHVINQHILLSVIVHLRVSHSIKNNS